jgi:hypothetical protein
MREENTTACNVLAEAPAYVDLSTTSLPSSFSSLKLVSSSWCHDHMGHLSFPSRAKQPLQCLLRHRLTRLLVRRLLQYVFGVASESAQLFLAALAFVLLFAFVHPG